VEGLTVDKWVNDKRHLSSLSSVMLQANPDATLEEITEVISEYGDLVDDTSDDLHKRNRENPDRGQATAPQDVNAAD
jgi:hypothetical protein